MSDRRRQRGAGEAMYVHSEQRRTFQSKPLHESRAFSPLPPRPHSYRDTRVSSRISEPLGLQGDHMLSDTVEPWCHFICSVLILLVILPVIVQGFCCPLQQRAGSGRVTHRVTPQSRGGGDGRLTLLSSFKGILESRAKARASAAKVTPKGGGPTVCTPGDPASKAAGECIIYVPIHIHISVIY